MQTSTSWRSFRMAAWLGWVIESNWTDPFLFAVYSIVKPISGAAILVIMYGIISQGNFDSALFPYIYLGNAFYIYVGAVMTGVSWAVVDDREHYKTLKYMYIAPIHIPLYLLGRGVARFVTGSIAVFITILAGVLFLNVKINIMQVDWLLFFTTLIVGVVMLALLGLLLAGLTLTLARHEGFIGEATAGALYIFSGAIFPLDVLPTWLRPIGYFMPTTYWLELLRRSLVGNVAQAFPTLANFSNLQILGVMVGLSIFFGVISVYVFRWCDGIARERGLIDRTTNY
ncbi:MAG TPA: ABC transporter permease [Anaerolineales bacterium]|nr:ABC transporter permease [Anaerolineales bacterium]HNM37734.1 ABC transporter permease [Anaerolineales bacterium]